ncbi:leucine-rich repeat-containing G-protein coupled receptor 6-like [Chironomus tepperi]|uniref:leucine-rich repeat-containing G-protein coupled receptor 6-like n=1 Tax=Chironomus tepperi TaxID=113505 RepID=UPI00391F723D
MNLPWKISLILLLFTIYSSNCDNHAVKCTKKTKMTFGHLKIIPACVIDDETDLKIHDENPTVKFENFQSEMKVIAIKDVEFWHIPNTINDAFPFLKGLQITNSNLKKITAENFEKLESLAYLNLHGNMIEELNKNLFHKNKLLTEIDLSSNKIKKIHPTAFTGILKITKLDLKSNLCIDKTFEDVKIGTIIDQVWSPCSSQYEIEELQKAVKTLKSDVKEIDNLKVQFDRINDKMAEFNISVNPIKSIATTTTTTPKPDSYIAQLLNIPISSVIPVPHTTLDITIVNTGLLVFVLVIVSCCMCCRKTPKPVETLKTIVVKGSDYEKIKGMTLNKTGNNDAGHDCDKLMTSKPIAENKQAQENESAGSFEDILDEGHDVVQTDWSVAYKSESEDKE